MLAANSRNNYRVLRWPFGNWPFGRRRRSGTHINRALGHAMSLFGVRREL